MFVAGLCPEGSSTPMGPITQYFMTGFCEHVAEPASIWQFIVTRVTLMLAALPAARRTAFCTIIFVKVTTAVGKVRTESV